VGRAKRRQQFAVTPQCLPTGQVVGNPEVIHFDGSSPSRRLNGTQGKTAVLAVFGQVDGMPENAKPHSLQIQRWFDFPSAVSAEMGLIQMRRKVLWQVKLQGVNAGIATVRTDIDGLDGVRADLHSNTAGSSAQAGAVVTKSSTPDVAVTGRCVVKHPCWTLQAASGNVFPWLSTV
jgi:hypothetical protein